MPAETQNNQLRLVVKELLKERSWSMRKFSELTEIDVATISRILNGKRKANLQHLEKFADCLEVPLLTLLEAAGYPIEQKKSEAHSDIHTSMEMIKTFLASSDAYDNNFSIARVEGKLEDYGQYAQTEEGKDTILKGFEEKLQKVGSIGPFITQLKGLYEKFRSGKVASPELILIGGVLLYFIIPVDVIPDYIFPIGYLDDALAVKIAGNTLANKGMVTDI